MKNLLRFVAVLFAVITLSALMAHLLELRVKINLSKENYLAVQSIYSGWAFLGIFEILAVLLVLLWALEVHRQKKIFPFLLIAVICFIVSLAIFFIFTFPANVATSNWTHLPANWELLRKRWEYSHALHAVLNFIGFCLLLVALLKERSNNFLRQ
jgi:hypothetical protein